jgi:hemerythrin-like domain-containing protein
MGATTGNDRAEQDLVAALLGAHARARELFDTAVHVLEAPETDDEIAADIAATMHRFLTFTNPQHELDEEQMIFAALRAAGRQEEVAPALEHMVEAHQIFDVEREQLATRWQEVARDPACLRDERPTLLGMTETLADALAQHRQHEERRIFPLIRKYVPPETQSRILAVLSRREARP